jgi:hypothetical protein
MAMSHVSRIELEINDLETLKEACRSLGLEFVADQKTFKWYGWHMGDYPLPDGFTFEDMGRCDHAVRVPGADYEVGVVRKGNGYVLLWDFWQGGGLEKVLGKKAGKLKQAYAVQRIRREARQKGYHCVEKRTDQGIRITLTV